MVLKKAYCLSQHGTAYAVSCLKFRLGPQHLPFWPALVRNGSLDSRSDGFGQLYASTRACPWGLMGGKSHYLSSPKVPGEEYAPSPESSFAMTNTPTECKPVRTMSTLKAALFILYLR